MVVVVVVVLMVVVVVGHCNAMCYVAAEIPLADYSNTTSKIHWFINLPRGCHLLFSLT
jgi:hypothetical protein